MKKRVYVVTGLGVLLLMGVLALGPGKAWMTGLVHGADANQTSSTEAGKAPQKPTQQAPAVTVETVAKGVFRQYVTLTGSVEPTTVAGLASPAEGPVLECSVREGDAVRAGQTVVRIGRQASAQALRASAAEELRRQNEEFKRVSVLVREKALSGDQLDLARASLERAKAALAQADQAAGDYVVTAPWDGIVSQVHVADGNFVAPRETLVDLYDPGSLVLRFTVAEDQAFVLRPGSKVLAVFDGLGDKEFELDIVRAYPGLDRRLRTRAFEARLPQKVAFIPGMFGRLRAVLHEESVMTVPVEAVVVQGGKNIVYRVVDGKASRRQIETGFEQDGRVLVRSGLEPGDKIVVGGIERVKDGAGVRVPGEGGGQVAPKNDEAKS